MTTYNTGNPIGSTEVKDLYDNAQNFDTLANTTTQETVPDRLGVPRMTFHGFEQAAGRSIASFEHASGESLSSFEQEATTLIDLIKFQPPIPYAPGIEVTTSSLTVDYLGVIYYALPSALPFTTGAWNPAQWSPVQNTYPGRELLVFEDYAAAYAAAATLPDGQNIESPNSDGNVHKYVVAAGSLVDLGAAETYLSGSNIASDSIWSDVPEVVGAGDLNAVNAQAQALADRTEHLKNAFRRLNPFDYGIVGDYETDDTVAFKAACQASADLNAYLDISGLNIRIVGGYDLPENVGLYADAPHKMSTWLADTDVQKMRSGYKHLVSGGNIWISGSGFNIYETNREDDYSDITYGLSYLHKQKARISGIGVILDVDIYTEADALTNRSNDNGTNCDCGLILRSYATELLGCNFFGYFNKQSVIIHSQKDYENTDSDYNGAFKTRFCGLALIGDGTGENGLTGNSFLRCEYYNSADYHNRSQGNYTQPCIFVDGPVAGATGIRGHVFDGMLRSYANDVIKLDRCRNITISLNTTETPALAGVAGADQQGRIVGTINTKAVYVTPSSMTANGLGLNAFALAITGPLVMLGGPTAGDVMCAANGQVIRIAVTPGTNDPIIQLSDSLGDYGAGISILRDISQGGALQIRIDGEQVWSIDPTSKEVRTRNRQRVDGDLHVYRVIKNMAGELDLRSASTSAPIRLRSGDETSWLADNTVFRPGSDADKNLATAGLRINNSFFAVAPTVSSDERIKSGFRSLREAEKAAALEIKNNIGLYQLNDAIAIKGADGARWHAGVKAQQVVSILQSHGLDWTRYAFIGYDEWDEQPELLDEEGNVTQEYQPAGNRYGIRYDELCMFILAAT